MHSKPGTQNPYFHLMTSFSPGPYYGSLYVLRQVMEGVSGPYPAALELTGLPGMGKSTLLRYLAFSDGAFVNQRQWLQPDFREHPHLLLPVLVQFRLKPANQHAFIYIHERFLEAYTGPYARRWAEAGDDLPLLPDLGLVAEDAMRATMQVAQGLSRLQRMGIRPVFLFDDFDLAFKQLTLEETTRLRPWREKASFTICTEQPLDQVNPEAAGSPFFQALTVLRLGSLERDEARRILVEPAQAAGWPLSEVDVEYLLDIVGTHPQLLFHAGRILWDLREEPFIEQDKSPALTPNQRAILRSRINKKARPWFGIYLERLSAREQQILQRLAKAGHLSLQDNNILAVDTLVQKGLATYETDQSVRLCCHLMADYLLEKPPRSVGTVAPPKPDTPPQPSLQGVSRRLYEYLRTHSDRNCTFEELATKVWQRRSDAGDEAAVRRRVQVTVSRLRKRLKETTGEDIISIRDEGYRLVLPDES